jgi:hypothetical protein
MKFSPENLALAQQELSNDFNITKTGSEQELLLQLAACINELIQRDFSKLVSILYRIDISENALRAGLEQQGDADTGLFIARLILDRQIQKQEMRTQFNRQQDIPDDEKW